MKSRASFCPVVAFRYDHALDVDHTDSDEIVMHLRDIDHMTVAGGLCYLTRRGDGFRYQLSVADYHRVKELWFEYETICS